MGCVLVKDRWPFRQQLLFPVFHLGRVENVAHYHEWKLDTEFTEL
jgi:hypothetical protein